MPSAVPGRFVTSRHLLRLALWCVLLAAASYTTADPDLWGHLRFGLDILRDGTVATVDPYSFSADRPWVNHEWGSEVITASAFTIGGSPGLVLLKVTMLSVVLALLLSSLRERGVDASVDRDVFAALAVLGTMEQTHHVRPQLFSVVCFSVLLWSLTATGRRARWGFWIIPVVFLLWANLHGGWMVGGAVLGVWVAGLVLTGRRSDATWYAAAGAVALAATLVTPYGFGLWRFLYDTVGFGRADIIEWQPVYALTWDAWARWAAIAGVGIAGLAAARGTERRLEVIGVLAALAFASFMVVRLLAFFTLSVLYLVGPALSRKYREMRTARVSTPLPPWRRRLLASTAAVTIACAASLSAANTMQVRIDPRHTPETDAVEFLRSQPGSKRLLVWFDWGEYAIWHLSPAMRVSVDGRRETVYSSRVQDEHLRFFFDAPGGAALPGTLAADYVWIPRELPAVRRLDAERWRKCYEGPTSVIFARAGLDVTPSRAVPTAPAASVFPGP
ncbi:MAG TPA: hypothetical protein VN654_31590 [Vicinamibacterales bacterium]|nr:hypothetical protein [Vicinamibacterales bacterium]